MKKKWYTAFDIDRASGTTSDLCFHDNGRKYTQEEFDEMVKLRKKIFEDLDKDDQSNRQ